MLSVVAIALAVSMSAGAAVPVAPAGSKLGMEGPVMAGLKTVETAKAGKLSVQCSLVNPAVGQVQCWAERAGAQHPQSAVTALATCKTSKLDARSIDPCSAKPVCTYTVTVLAGYPAKASSSAVVNVCRKGWAAKVG